ncbi:MAG: 5,5-dehydrodivanillate O-demethylase oxygenase subunit [Chloroflexota bacterium]|nr:5,5-dehydrodivanillate O-demethylase oxygenase subunit [Chloroflexota bacterium]
MLTKEENERLTRVGPGTPMGGLLRRYWYPVAGVAELEDEPTKAVRLLGEDLVLYRDRSGEYGLLGQHCPHRKASLEYGVPEEHGLRCCYHGWLFDPAGNCLEQPAEPAESSFKDRIHHTAYPVQPLGGLLWAYLGPQPAPLLPRFDVFAWEDAWRDIGVNVIPCNWLQCVENSIDLTHVDWLHGHYYDYVLERKGKPRRTERVYGGAHHVKIGFDLFDFGIVKRRMVEGSTEESWTWAEGTNPLIFPNATRAGGSGSLQIRVPVDDTHTMNVLYSCYRPNDGQPVPAQERIPVYNVPVYEQSGRYKTDWITGQDMMAWVTQGPIMDRTDEKLGASDQGIIFYRKVLVDQLEKVERGEDPLGVLRDPAKNVLIELKRERNTGRTGFMDNHWQQFSPIFKEAKALLERSKATPVER